MIHALIFFEMTRGWTCVRSRVVVRLAVLMAGGLVYQTGIHAQESLKWENGFVQIEEDYRNACKACDYAPRECIELGVARIDSLQRIYESIDRQSISRFDGKTLVHYSGLLEILKKHKEVADVLLEHEKTNSLDHHLALVLLRAYINTGQFGSAETRLLQARDQASFSYASMDYYHSALAEAFYRRGDLDRSVSHLLFYLDAQINHIESDVLLGKTFSRTLGRLMERSRDWSWARQQIEARRDKLLQLEKSFVRVGMKELPPPQRFAVRSAFLHARTSFQLTLRKDDSAILLSKYLTTIFDRGHTIAPRIVVRELMQCRDVLIANSFLWCNSSSLLATIDTLIQEESDPLVENWLIQFRRELAQQREWQQQAASLIGTRIPVKEGEQRPPFSVVVIAIPDSQGFLSIPDSIARLNISDVVRLIVLIPAIDSNPMNLDQVQQLLPMSRYPNQRVVLTSNTDFLEGVDATSLPIALLCDPDNTIRAAVSGLSSQNLLHIKSLLPSATDQSGH